jgi:hypothetical protein
MSGRENPNQIPKESNEEQTKKIIERQERVPGEQRDKTVTDFPQAAAVGQILKDAKFPAQKQEIVRLIEQSNNPERNEVLPIIQRIDDRQYQNVAEVAEAARLVQH